MFFSTNCLYADCRLRSIHVWVRISRGRGAGLIPVIEREEQDRTSVSAINTPLIRRGDTNVIGTLYFDVTRQSPYELVVESLPPTTGHAVNSRHDSRPFNNAFESFLFSRITLCVFAGPPFSPGSATHT